MRFALVSAVAVIALCACEPRFSDEKLAQMQKKPEIGVEKHAEPKEAPENFSVARDQLMAHEVPFRRLAIVTAYMEINEHDKTLKVDTPENTLWALKVMAMERKFMSEISERADWLELGELFAVGAENFSEAVKEGDMAELAKRQNTWGEKWKALMEQELELHKDTVHISADQEREVFAIAKSIAKSGVASSMELASREPGTNR